MERCFEAAADPSNKARAAAAPPPPPAESSAARLTKLALFHRRTLRWEGPCFWLLPPADGAAAAPPVALEASRRFYRRVHS